MDPLARFRKTKDDFFARDPDSPLTPEQRSSFKGLKYFAPNPDLRFEVKPEEFPDKETVRMQTTTGSIQEYQRFGRITVQADGQTAALTVYRDKSGYFLPFVDSLSPQETYPAGRYLEPHPLGGGRLLVDFNYAYNPYCAYNDSWSCPLTPFENRIPIPIRAGEKNFHD